MAKNLITGINGFAASHLCDLLLANGEEVVGIAKTLEENQNIAHAVESIEVFSCDVRILSEIKRVLDIVRPNKIYHMASVSFVPAATQNWNLAFETKADILRRKWDSIVPADVAA